MTDELSIRKIGYLRDLLEDNGREVDGLSWWTVRRGLSWGYQETVMSRQEGGLSWAVKMGGWAVRKAGRGW